MSPIEIGCLGLLVLFAIIAIGIPIGFAMALVGFWGCVFLSGWEAALCYLTTVPISTVASYTLSVLPLFILMGEFASISGLTEGAFNGLNKWLGRLPGGLAMATVGGCAAFGAVCGSGIAAATTFCTVAYPEMRRYNYDPKLSLGSIAAGGTLAVLIPPSNPLIIYSIFAEESVGKLFMAGFFPGFLLAGLMMLTAYIWVKFVPSMGPTGPKYTWRQRLAAGRDIWPVLLLAFFILGGIWGGIFSPSEAGGIGAFLAFVIGLSRGQFSIQKIGYALRHTVTTTAMVFTIIIGAMIFNYFVTLCGLPEATSRFMEGLHWPPMGILVTILFIYFILGALMDELAMTVLTLPIFLPILRSLGIDLIWFGVLFVIMCQTGMVAPPVGINVFVISGMVRDVPMFTIYRGILPFLIAMLVCLVFVIFFPQIALFLPNTMIRR